MAEAESQKPMFTDELERTLDSGLRVTLPKDWRGLNITEFFLISGSSSSFIKAFPRSEYDRFIAKIESDETLDEDARNEMLEEIGSACKRVEVDSSGRLALPGDLCASIGVSVDKPKVVLKGAVRTFNIWNPSKLSNRQEASTKMEEAGKPRLSAKKFLGV
jgi:DNA-binding transcriptional regulator/RsmH inhibitor MraZ